ncbi:vWA domain-containing protein [Marinomonas ostreistagni]|uniref:vWA domain-containing protein n=1 Tax=Marinomonas ostreistagni TaxID=359209 RepID=UPI001951F895|nr:VWA domain-containing protein [Marinomonas ostreistagni]MBM6551939.1 VWA domain-containing protein [Marinomonas ostreistagni]
MLELQWPWALLALPLPLLILWRRPASDHHAPLYWRYGQTLRDPHASRSAFQQRIPLLLLLSAWLCLIVAIARPTWLGEPTRIPPTGRDLLIALDLSGSMQISDMTLEQQPADRLMAAKRVLEAFIKDRQGDRVGIIVFGSKAFLQAPLSYDLDTINQLIQETQIGFAGEQTAIGDAIGLGIKRLEDKPAEQKVLILMTDGANTAGRVSPLQAANFAAKENVTIHTIGIGADTMTVQGFFGPKVINPSSDLDEPLLTNIAELTGGRFFRARSTEELHAIYRILDELEPTPSDAILQRPQTTLFHWLGLLALGLFSLAMVMTKRIHWTLRGRS